MHVSATKERSVAGPHGVLITGGGSGVGLACAERFVAAGAAVTLVGRNEERLLAASTRLGGVPWIGCDVADEEGIARAVAEADGTAPLRTVVAAADADRVGALADLDLHDWRRIVDLNLTGPFLLVKHAGPRLAARGGGSVVVVSSVDAARPTRLHGAYAATKAGVEALVQAAADEFGPSGVRVNAVRAGVVRTTTSARLLEVDDIRADLAEQTPLEPPGSTADVAAAVAWLASDAAGWVTGTCLDVDGGHHLRRGVRLDAWLTERGGDESDEG